MSSKYIAIAVGVLVLAYLMIWRNCHQLSVLYSQRKTPTMVAGHTQKMSLNQNITAVHQRLDPYFAVTTSQSGVVIQVDIEQLDDLTDRIMSSSWADNTDTITWELTDSGGECHVTFK